MFFILVIFSVQSLAQTSAPYSYDRGKPVEITADTLEVLQEESKAIFTGSVQAKQGDLDIRSQKMQVYYKSNDNGKKQNTTGSQISRVELEGGVFVSTPKETAQGNVGIYDVEKGFITLEGDVTLTSMKNIVKGEKLLYNLKTGQSKIVSEISKDPKKKASRVRGVFVPNNK